MKKDHPKICFVGNLLGRNAGYITTQGQIMADLFADEGYENISVSSEINRVKRLADITSTIIRNRNEIDLVVLEVYSGLSMIMADTASSLCKLFGIPLISVLRGGNLPNFSKKYPRWTKRVLRSADILVAPSSFLAEEFNFLELDIRVVPNIVRLQKYPYRIRHNIAPKFIWMRSFHPLYNPKMAIRAFAEIQRIYPQATLVMAGNDKGIEAESKQFAKELGLENSIRFPGFLDLEAKCKEFSEADIYLNTNKIDNMPVSVVEACSMGLPVIATEVGGLKYLLTNGENGILVSNDNADEMAEAIKNLLNNPDLTEKLSKNGRLLAEKSSWENVRNLWETLFEEVLTKRKGKQELIVEKASL